MSESDSNYPKAEFFRKLNLSKNSPNVPKCGLNTRHDSREVTWRDSYSIFPKTEFVRIFTECSGVRIEHTTQWWWSDTYSFDTSAHLALWQMRHRFNPRKRVNDYQLYSMIGAHVYVLYHRQLIFALSCRRRSFLQVLQSIRRIFWNIFCVSDDDKCYVDNMS